MNHMGVNISKIVYTSKSGNIFFLRPAPWTVTVVLNEGRATGQQNHPASPGARVAARLGRSQARAQAPAQDFLVGRVVQKIQPAAFQQVLAVPGLRTERKLRLPSRSI
jgi:hypothetical protein